MQNRFRLAIYDYFEGKGFSKDTCQNLSHDLSEKVNEIYESAQQSVQADRAKCLKCGRTQKQHDEALLNGHSFDPPRR